MGTLVVSLLPAGRPDRSGPLTPYPIPHASHTRPREGSKKSQTKEHHLHLITQVNFGSRDGRGSTKSGVSTLGYGVWGMIDTDPAISVGESHLAAPRLDGKETDRIEHRKANSQRRTPKGVRSLRPCDRRSSVDVLRRPSPPPRSSRGAWERSWCRCSPLVGPIDPHRLPHTPYPKPHTPDPGKVPKNLRPKNITSTSSLK